MENGCCPERIDKKSVRSREDDSVKEKDVSIFSLSLSLDRKRKRKNECVFNWLIDTVRMYLHIIHGE